jgi:hypothetical protein
VTVNLTDDQLQELANLSSAGEYSEAYRYLEQATHSYYESNPAEPGLIGLRTWLTLAADIDADNGSWSSDLVRNYTYQVGEYLSIPVDKHAFDVRQMNLPEPSSTRRSTAEGSRIYQKSPRLTCGPPNR